jgi:hypothetical protein
MKVWLCNEALRGVLRHPGAGPFPTEGPADWPDDSFTYRRIKDGDVSTEESKAGSKTSKTDEAPKAETKAERKSKGE